MSIQFPCPFCSQIITVVDSAAGKKGKCDHCHNVISVPAETPPSGTTDKPSAPPPPPAPPPPMPSSTTTPPAPPLPQPATPANILDSYRQTSTGGGSTARASVARGVGAIKARAQAVKLKHDLKGLHTALDQQWENLGLLTVEHRPPQIDITAELAQLTDVQSKLAEKQTTLNSLHQTKGSGPVVKELKREEAALREQQRQLMIAIGRKTAQARPDLPGAAGPYSAIDQIQSSLAAKQADLAALQEQIGSVREGGPPSLGSLKKPLIIGGGVVAGLIVVYALWSLFTPGAIPSWGRELVPDDLAALMYVNMDALRESDLYDKLPKEGRNPLQAVGIELDDDDLSAVLNITPEKGAALILFYTTEDWELEDLLKESKSKYKLEDYQDSEYAAIEIGSEEKFELRTSLTQGEIWELFGEGGADSKWHKYLARTGKRTFCFTYGEDAVKAAIKRAEEGDEAELDEDLQEAISYFSVKDAAYMVGTGEGLGSLDSSLDIMLVPVLETSGAKASGSGGSVGSSLRSKAVIVFRKKQDAQKYAKRVEEFLDDVIEELEDELDDAKGVDEEVMAFVLAELKSVDVDRSGRVAELTSSSDMDDVLEVLDLDEAKSEVAISKIEKIIAENAKD